MNGVRCEMFTCHKESGFYNPYMIKESGMTQHSNFRGDGGGGC
jgi:hypothetical protein